MELVINDRTDHELALPLRSHYDPLELTGLFSKYIWPYMAASKRIITCMRRINSLILLC